VRIILIIHYNNNSNDSTVHVDYLSQFWYISWSVLWKNFYFCRWRGSSSCHRPTTWWRVKQCKFLESLYGLDYPASVFRWLKYKQVLDSSLCTALIAIAGRYLHNCDMFEQYF